LQEGTVLADIWRGVSASWNVCRVVKKGYFQGAFSFPEGGSEEAQGTGDGVIDLEPGYLFGVETQVDLGVHEYSEEYRK
jgi:hypothetical protein